MADSQGLGWLESKTPLRHASRCLAVTYQRPSAVRYGCSALRIQEGVRQGGASAGRIALAVNVITSAGLRSPLF